MYTIPFVLSQYVLKQKDIIIKVIKKEEIYCNFLIKLYKVLSRKIY